MSYFPNDYMLNKINTRTSGLKQNTMTLEGIGRIKIIPDLAVIHLGIVTENEQANIAQQENTVRSNQVIQTLKNLGIVNNDIQSISYTIQPQYDYNEGKAIFRGYRVEHLLEVTIRKIEKIGEVYNAAINSGANIASSLQFQVSDYEKYYNQALQIALKNAKEKAKEIGQQLGVTILPIPINIKEESSPTLFQGKAAPFMAQAQTAPPIQRREVEIEAKVKTVFQY